MKKSISIILALVLIISTVTGCSKKEVSKQPDNTKVAAEGNKNTSTTGTVTNTTASNSSNTGTTTTNTTTSTTSNSSDSATTTSTTGTSATTSTTTTQQAQASGDKKEGTTSQSSGTSSQASTSTVDKTTTTSKTEQNSTQASKPTEPVVKLEDALRSALSYMERNAVARQYKISDWDAIALRVSGKAIDGKYVDNLGAAVIKDVEKYYMTDYARTILGVMTAGYDPTNFQGMNLVDTVKNSMIDNGKFKDTLKGGEDLVNCHVWSMIALEAAKADYSRDLALKYLEGKQNSDGGFYIFAPYPDSDTDFTAMAVIALSMAKRDATAPSVKKALSYLKTKLAEMEKDTKLQSAETLSVILEALVAAGQDVNSYKINGKTIVDELMSYKAKEGFKHVKTGNVNEIATRQVVTAFEFYNGKKNIYTELSYKKNSYYASQKLEIASVKLQEAFYDVASGKLEFVAKVDKLDEVKLEITDGKNNYNEALKPENGMIKLSKDMPAGQYEMLIKGIRGGNTIYVYATKLEKVTTKSIATVRIESYDKNILINSEVETGNLKVYDFDGNAYSQAKLSAYSFVMKALNSAGVKSAVSYSYGAPYIYAVNDVFGGKFGGWDGWMFFVNGKDPGVGMTDVEIKEGDEILVYYGDWGIKPLELSIPEIAPRNQEVEIKVLSEGKSVEGATVYINRVKYLTDAKGVAYISIKEIGDYEIYAEKQDESGKPLFVRSTIKKITIR